MQSSPSSDLRLEIFSISTAEEVSGLGFTDNFDETQTIF